MKPDIKPDIKPNIYESHSIFSDSIKWALDIENGIKVYYDVYADSYKIPRTAGTPSTVKRVWNNYNTDINFWAEKYEVPVELAVACISTESGGNPSAVREEPGYVNDIATPGKISVGLMQSLISNAQWILGNENMSIKFNKKIDRAWLLSPENAIHAGIAFINYLEKKTDFDPPRVAAAYNAGGVYPTSKNRWKMKSTTNHIDRFVAFFNDFVWLIHQDDKNIVKPRFSFAEYKGMGNYG